MQCTLGCVQLFETRQAVVRQAPRSMGSSSQEYWSGLPFPLSGDLPDAGIEPGSFTSPALAGRLPKHFVRNMVNMIQTEESGFNLQVLFVVAWSTRFTGHSM